MNSKTRAGHARAPVKTLLALFLALPAAGSLAHPLVSDDTDTDRKSVV